MFAARKPPNDPGRLRRSTSFTSPANSPEKRPLSRSQSRASADLPSSPQPIATISDLIRVLKSTTASSPVKSIGKSIRRAMPFSTDKTSKTTHKLEAFLTSISSEGGDSEAFNTEDNRTRFLYACLPLFVDSEGSTSQEKRIAIADFVLDRFEQVGRASEILSELTRLDTYLTGRGEPKLAHYEIAKNAFGELIAIQAQERGVLLVSSPDSTMPAKKPAWQEVAQPSVSHLTDSIKITLPMNQSLILKLGETPYYEARNSLMTLVNSSDLPKKHEWTDLPRRFDDQNSIKDQRKWVLNIARKMSKVLSEPTGMVGIDTVKENILKTLTFMAASIFEGDLARLDYHAYALGMEDPHNCDAIIQLRTQLMVRFKASAPMGGFPHEAGFSATSLEALKLRLVRLARGSDPGIGRADVLADMNYIRCSLILFMNEVEHEHPLLKNIQDFVQELGQLIIRMLKNELIDFEVQRPAKESLVSDRSKRYGRVFEPANRQGIVFEETDFSFGTESITDDHDPELDQEGASYLTIVTDSSHQETAEKPLKPLNISGVDLMRMRQRILSVNPGNGSPVDPVTQQLLDAIDQQMIGATPPTANAKSVPEKPIDFYNFVSAWDEVVAVEAGRLETFKTLSLTLGAILENLESLNAKMPLATPIDEAKLTQLIEALSGLIAQQENLVAKLQAHWQAANPALEIYRNALVTIGPLSTKNNETKTAIIEKGKLLEAEKAKWPAADPQIVTGLQDEIAALGLVVAETDNEIVTVKSCYRDQTEFQIQIMQAAIGIANEFKSEIEEMTRLTIDFVVLRMAVFGSSKAVKATTNLREFEEFLPREVKENEKVNKNTLDSMMVKVDAQRFATFPLALEAGEKKVPEGPVKSFLQDAQLMAKMFADDGNKALGGASGQAAK